VYVPGVDSLTGVPHVDPLQALPGVTEATSSWPDPVT